MNPLGAAAAIHLPLRPLRRLLSMLLLPLSVLGGPLLANAAPPEPAEPAKPAKPGRAPPTLRRAPPDTTGPRAALAAGQIVLKTYNIKGYGVPRIVAEAVVDAPAAAIFAIVSDCRNIKRLVEAVDAVKLISRSATRHSC